MDDRLSFDADKPVLVIGGAGVDIVGRLRSELDADSSSPAQIRYSFGGVRPQRCREPGAAWASGPADHRRG